MAAAIGVPGVSRAVWFTPGTADQWHPKCWGPAPDGWDAPSAYIAPETFDVLTLIEGRNRAVGGRGPRPGWCALSASADFSSGPVNFTASALGGSAGRNDQNADLAVGNSQYYARSERQPFARPGL